MRLIPNFRAVLRGLLGIVLVGFALACQDILEEPDISSQQLILISPGDSVTVTVNALNFDWEALADIRGYRIQIATPNFRSPQQILLDSTLNRDSLDRTPTRIQWNLLNGTYAWRVQGLNGGFQTPYTTRTLFVSGEGDADTAPPNTPVPMAPEDGATQSAGVVSFQWSRESLQGSMESDSLYIFEDADLTVLNHKDIGVNYTYTHTLPAGTFFWRVIAFDQAGNTSAPSETFSLTLN